MNMLEEMRETMERSMRGAPRQLRRDRLSFVRAARLFKFDPEASAFLGRTRASLRGLMMEQEQFAIPPYPATLLQVNYRSYCLAQPGSERVRRDVDEHVAYCISDAGGPHDVRIAVVVHTGEHCQPLPFCYERNTDDDPVVKKLIPRLTLMMQEHMLRDPGAEPHRDSIARFSDADMRRVLLGGTHAIDFTFNDREFTNPALDHWGIKVWGDAAFPVDDTPQWSNVLIEQRGDLAIPLSALLMMNRPKRDILSVSDEPAGIGVSAGKIKPYAAYNVVSLCLEPKLAERRLRRSAEGWKNRGHEVAGHYQHRPARLKASQCEHDWEQLDDRRWRCRRCPLQRTWIPYQEQRGDASLGWVRKHYEVTA